MCRFSGSLAPRKPRGDQAEPAIVNGLGYELRKVDRCWVEVRISMEEEKCGDEGGEHGCLPDRMRLALANAVVHPAQRR